MAVAAIWQWPHYEGDNGMLDYKDIIIKSYALNMSGVYVMFTWQKEITRIYVKRDGGYGNLTK